MRNREVVRTQITATINDKWSSSIPVVGTRLQVKIQTDYVGMKRINIFSKKENNYFE